MKKFKKAISLSLSVLMASAVLITSSASVNASDLPSGQLTTEAVAEAVDTAVSEVSEESVAVVSETAEVSKEEVVVEKSAPETVATPVITSVKNVNGGVQVTWDAVEGAAKYRVYKKSGSGSWERVAETAETTTVVTGLTAGTKYTFTVRCVSEDGKKFISDYNKTGVSITVSLATPVLESVSNVQGGVLVSWNAVEGASTYRVYKKSGSGNWVKVGETAETSLVATGLNVGTKYTFTVRCLSEDGKSFASDYDKTGKSVTYMLSAPVVTSVANADGGVQVTWDAVEGAAKYHVYKKSGNGSWVKAGATTDTSLVVTGLTPATEYAFTVRCFTSDSKTYTSDYDKTGKSIKYMLSTPVVTSVANVNGGVQVTWNAVNGAAKYHVYKKSGNGSWVKAGATTDTNFVVTGLTAGTEYSFTVRCFTGDSKTYTSDYDKTGKSVVYSANRELKKFTADEVKAIADRADVASEGTTVSLKINDSEIDAYTEVMKLLRERYPQDKFYLHIMLTVSDPNYTVPCEVINTFNGLKNTGLMLDVLSHVDKKDFVVYNFVKGAAVKNDFNPYITFTKGTSVSSLDSASSITGKTNYAEEYDSHINTIFIYGAKIDGVAYDIAELLDTTKAVYMYKSSDNYANKTKAGIANSQVVAFKTPSISSRAFVLSAE